MEENTNATPICDDSVKDVNPEIVVNENTSPVEELRSTQDEALEILDHLIHSQIEVKDHQIDRLHEELEHYKKDESERYITQFLKSIIKIRKDMKKVMERGSWNEMSADELRKEFTYTFEDLSDVLEQNLIDEFTTPEGCMFDASIHQARTEMTDDPELDKTVKASISEGYKKNGKVIIPERVIVYVKKN